VGAVLLVLRGGRLAGHHLHLHRPWQKQLLLLLLLLLLLVLERVNASFCVDGLSWSLHHIVLHSLRGALAGVVVGHARRVTLRLLVVVLVQLVDV